MGNERATAEAASHWRVSICTENDPDEHAERVKRYFSQPVNSGLPMVGDELKSKGCVSDTSAIQVILSFSFMVDPQSRSIAEVWTVLRDFEEVHSDIDLRSKVKALIPAFEAMRKLGKSLVPDGLKMSARDRLLAYFCAYPQTVLNEKELAVVAGISEWARRVRELRVQFGWKIVTGVTAKQMHSENDLWELDVSPESLGPKDYVLLDTSQDRESAFRWNVANEIRKASGGAKERILQYFLNNVGEQITGEELRYVAKSSEWARRTRELRTEEGWPISTKMSGNPNLAPGVYVLEKARQAPAHDRKISESVRRTVLRRDEYRCTRCDWSYSEWNPSDPRFLELHHLVHHAKGGANDAKNLKTLCNVCHDELHRNERTG